jgi:hypothetical protein
MLLTIGLDESTCLLYRTLTDTMRSKTWGSRGGCWGLQSVRCTGNKRICIPRETSSDGLCPPSHGVTNSPCFPDQVRCNTPGPDELPYHTGPPFPSNTQVSELLDNGCSTDLSSWKTKRRMIFPASDPHDHRECHLGKTLAVVSDIELILLVPE